MASSSPAIAPRRRRLPLGRIVVFLVLAAGGIWLAINEPWVPKPLAVAVETLKSGPASRVLAVNGRLEPVLSINVSPTVNGQIRTVAVNDGDEVAAGTVLATMDDAQQQSALQQTQSSLDSAINKLGQARIDLDRAKSLGDAISRKDFDTAQLALQTAQADVDRLTAARNQAASLLSQYNIVAPFTGTVVTRAVDPGQVVATSTVLFTLADLSHLRAEASIDEIYSAEMKRGLKAKLQPSGYSKTLDGEVSFVSPTVDSATGGRLIRVSIENGDGLTLPIGLTVNLNIVVAEEASALTVPRSAIVTVGGEPGVYIVADGKATFRPIDFIDWPSARLIVTSGLAADDQVITAPKGVTAGAAVTPKAG